MDFRQSTQPGAARPAGPTPAAAPEHKDSKQASGKKPRGRSLLTFATAVLLVGVAVLIAVAAVAISRGNTTAEYRYVNTSKYQAVFLNNGQVYFGNVKTLNSKVVRLTDVYYLTQSGDATSSNYSLVKLGCQQIHDPYDEMVINREQVTFWENLNADGKVVKSIEEFKKQNPNGPDCSQVSNQTQAGSTTTQGTNTTGTNGTSTGTGTDTTKK